MQNFASYFDRVFCLSMPQSQDRRAHIKKHLGALGIEGYEFFDAVGPDHPDVLALYENRRVLSYPPCFRCGELTCDLDDCNNVLIPEQVATCVSFLRLWRHILDRKIQTAMVVEDDVVFADYARKVAAIAMDRGLLDQTGIRGQAPTLLRMGWPAGDEHHFTGEVSLQSDQDRDSNHCFAVNAAMCRKLLDEFRGVDTTADIYTHRIVGPMVRNFNLQPPLATDLSYSFGAVDSLIHPKRKRVQYLKRYHPDQVDKIEAVEQAVRRHVKHVTYRPLLAVGHPGCGAAYLSQLLASCGLDVGHDSMGKDGICSWALAVADDENPFARDSLARSRQHKHFGHVIHFVRDPRTAIPDIVQEDRRSRNSFEFRRKHVLKTFGVDLAEAGSDLERAASSYVYWNKMIADGKPDFVVQIEAAVDSLPRFLRLQGIVPQDSAPASASARYDAAALLQGGQCEGAGLTDADWRTVDETVMSQLNSLCLSFGYGALDAG